MDILREEGTRLLAAGGGVGAIAAGARVVCLYFSARWCPDCVPATPVLRDVYEDAAGGSDWDVVYVPSDKNATETEEYVKAAHGGWPRVETNSDVAAKLKRRFGVCARKEAGSLGITERKAGIPTLVVLDAHSGDTIEMDGMTAIRKSGPRAIKAWLAKAEQRK
eukprot:PRCOL_00003329-RA